MNTAQSCIQDDLKALLTYPGAGGEIELCLRFRRGPLLQKGLRRIPLYAAFVELSFTLIVDSVLGFLPTTTAEGCIPSYTSFIDGGAWFPAGGRGDREAVEGCRDKFVLYVY